MKCNLTFKKAFGIRTIPVDFSFWLMEIGNQSFNFCINKKPVCVKIGNFGTTKEEKIILSGFYHSDERDLNNIGETLTIDIKLSVELPINSHQKISQRNELTNLVEPFIDEAFLALKRIVDAHRTAKYKIKHKSDEWRKGQLPIIPEITEAEFKTYLFYELNEGEKSFYGCFSNGQVMSSSSTDNELIAKEIENIVGNEIHLSSKLIVLAWEYLFKEDFRNSIIYTATVLELLIIKHIRNYYVAKDVATGSQIDKFLDNVSNRLLCTVTLGSLGVGDKALRDRVASIFDTRNGLVHGKRKLATKEEAEKAIKDSEDLIDELEKLTICSATNCNN